jgi:rubrerythrin
MAEISIDSMNMLHMALKKEENAYNFYNRAQGMARLSNVRDLFQELAGEELKHKEVILGYMEKYQMKEGDWNPPQDAEDTDEVGYSQFLTKTKLTEETTYQDALIIALKREENSYVMFRNFYSIVKDEDLRGLFKRLMDDEIDHLKKIEAKYDKDIMSDN